MELLTNAFTPPNKVSRFDEAAFPGETADVAVCAY
jgi:hypothetical protein